MKSLQMAHTIKDRAHFDWTPPHIIERGGVPFGVLLENRKRLENYRSREQTHFKSIIHTIKHMR